ncbi:ATP-binding protein, partial [Ornithinicoccus halotolerans]|uniref:ATP-binding protein n=1 Tax=Ornithinicoccus halotolerans TaxID=1748220 RepID=UPI001E31970D
LRRKCRTVYIEMPSETAMVDRADLLADRAARAAEQLAEAEQRLGEQERELTAARAAADGARRDEEDVTERAGQAEATEERARARQRWHAVTQALHTDAQAVAELEQLQEQQAVARERLASVATATRERCEQARLLAQEIALLEEQARESAARWRLETLAGELVATVAGEQVRVTEGTPAERVLDADTVVEVPGSLRMVLRAGDSERACATRVEHARGRLAALLRDAGVDTVGRLADAAAERQQATEELDRLQRRITALTAGPVLGQERRAELAREAAALERELGEAHGTDGEPDPQQALDLVRAVRSEERRVRRARQEADAALQEVLQRRSSLELAVARTRTLLEQCTAQRDECRTELAEARRERDDELLHTALEQARAAVREAHARAHEARRHAVESGAGDAAGELEQAREELERHDRHVQEVRGERDRLAGQLELVLGEGRQEQLDRALADLEHARQELDSVSRRARAVRQLRATLLRHRESAQQAYARPYTAAVEALGREVYGDRFAVEVADDLHIVARVLDGVRVPVEQLSGGAQEQLGVLCRLAVAGLVDQTEGVPVVLDDALGFTDPERLADIVRVLGAASSDAQVLLLTCVPERVAGLDEARRVTLRPAS